MAAKNKVDDNWNWPIYIINRIKTWFQTAKITITDCFRILDHDFDGQISKQDLQNFIINVLKEQEKEITESKLNRVHKLLDFFKRGQVQMIDIEQLLLTPKIDS